MKKIIVLIIMLLALVGCSEEKPVGTFSDITVKDKKTEGGRYVKYYVIFEKDGQEVELKATSENEFEALKKGTVVTVSYDDEYYIKNIKFPKLQNKTKE